MFIVLAKLNHGGGHMTIEEILAGESKNVEFKVQRPDKSIKYMKTVVAFANLLMADNEANEYFKRGIAQSGVPQGVMISEEERRANSNGGHWKQY